MVSGSSDKIIFVWNLEEVRLHNYLLFNKKGQCELILKGHESGVYCLEFFKNTLISGSGDKTIRIWDLEEGKCQKILKY